MILSVGHCNYSSILYHFRVFLTLNSDLEIWVKIWCGFLFAFHSNYGAILYVSDYWSKIAKFYTPPVFSAPAGVTIDLEFREAV